MIRLIRCRKCRAKWVNDLLPRSKTHCPACGRGTRLDYSGVRAARAYLEAAFGESQRPQRARKLTEEHRAADRAARHVRAAQYAEVKHRLMCQCGMEYDQMAQWLAPGATVEQYRHLAQSPEAMAEWLGRARAYVAVAPVAMTPLRELRCLIGCCLGTTQRDWCREHGWQPERVTWAGRYAAKGDPRGLAWTLEMLDVARDEWGERGNAVSTRGTQQQGNGR